MTILWFDCETYSEVDLKTAGTHRYAEAPSTEIMIAQYALDDDEPTVIDCTDPNNAYWVDQDLRMLLEDPDVIVRAHNSAFDRTLVRHCWGIDVPVERWEDTMVAALAHGLPGALGKLGPILGIPEDQQKDKRGKELIQLFCKPRPKNHTLRRATSRTHPREWEEFLEYSRQDVPAMREVHRRLPVWNYQGKELALWHLDQRINDRGFAVDLDLARVALKATDTEKARLKTETQEASDGLVSGPSKREDLLAFILAEYGVQLPDMKADTLRRRLEDPELPDGVKLLINLRLEANKASTAKYLALTRATSGDGRLRNALQFAGALRTARWAGRIFQPQNIPRPSKGFDVDQQDMGIAALKGGYADVVFGNVMQLMADCLRGAIVAGQDRKLVVADLANIEGRMLAWLAGEDWKLQAFRNYDDGTGADLYNLAYARSFDIAVDRIPEGGRQIGKVMELALGYEGGVAAFLTFAAVYNMDLAKLTDAVHRAADNRALAAGYGIYEWALKKGMSTFGMAANTYVACEVLKASWRKAHPATVELWAAAKEGVENAINNPGVTFDIGAHLKARVDGAWLRLRLPSGRYLCYLQPKVERGQITYMGVNQYTRQWTRIKTYGGKLIENATQAAARDVMGANMPAIERAGYEIVLTVHDEVLTETPADDAFTHEGLEALLAAAPSWAEGLPLAAAGFETTRYRKD